MAKNKKYAVSFKRKREHKTDYNKRLGYLKSDKLRLVIRPKNNNIIVQIVEYSPKGDKTVIYVHSKELTTLGWKSNKGNIPSSYLTGYLLGKKAIEHKIKDAVLDIGQHKHSPKSKIYAALKGVLDAGLLVPHSKEVLPDEETVSGQKISNYGKMISNQNMQNITTSFKEIKSKISAHRGTQK